MPATGCLLHIALDVSFAFLSFLACLGPLFCRRFSKYLRWLTFFVLVDLPNASCMLDVAVFMNFNSSFDIVLI